MGFRYGAYMRIWELEPHEKFTTARVSTSRKNKQTGDYEQDFSGFVTLIGAAHTEAAGMQPNCTVRIGNCEVTNRYDKEKQKSYTNFNVYSFKHDDGENERPVQKPDAVDVSVDDSEDMEELPF